MLQEGQAPPLACPHPLPTVLQSQSMQALAQWLETQEDAVHQLQAANGQLWAHLNTSAKPGGHR